jgi:predicted small metal-binding protein
VIDCDCGATLQAANDDDLVRVAREHVNEVHPDMDIDDDGLRALVADKAYDASDS